MTSTAHWLTAPTATPTPATADQHGSDLAMLYLALLLVALFIGWRISLIIHPWRHCRRCDSDPRSYGAIFRKSFAICPRCQGTGRELRWSAKNPNP